MKITIDGDPKEIAALVLAVQERQDDHEEATKWIINALYQGQGNKEKLPKGFRDRASFRLF